MTFSYSLLEYSLMKLVGPRKKAQITPKLPQRIPETSLCHSHESLYLILHCLFAAFL